MSNPVPSIRLALLCASAFMPSVASAQSESICFPESELCQECQNPDLSCYCDPGDCTGVAPEEPPPPGLASIEAMTTCRETLDVAAAAEVAVAGAKSDLDACGGLTVDECIASWAEPGAPLTRLQPAINTYLGTFLKPYLTNNDQVCPTPDDPDNRVDIDGQFEIREDQNAVSCTTEHRTRVTVTHMCNTPNGLVRYMNDFSDVKRFPCVAQDPPMVKFGGRVKTRQNSPDTLDVRFEVEVVVASHEVELSVDGNIDDIDIQAFIFGREVVCQFWTNNFNNSGNGGFDTVRVWCPWYRTGSNCCNGWGGANGVNARPFHRNCWFC